MSAVDRRTGRHPVTAVDGDAEALAVAREQVARWNEYAKGNGRSRRGRALRAAALAMARGWQTEVDRLLAPTRTGSTAQVMQGEIITWTIKIP